MLKNAKLWQFSWSQACEKLSNKRVGIKCHEKKRHFFTQQYEDYIFLLNIKSVLAGYIFTSLLIHHQQVKFLPNISPSSLVPTSSILRPILVSYLFTPVQLIFSPPPPSLLSTYIFRHLAPSTDILYFYPSTDTLCQLFCCIIFHMPRTRKIATI